MVSHLVYRCSGHDGRYLYIGATCSLPRRITEHSRKAAWWPAVARITLLPAHSQAEARRIEAAMIAVSRPSHNRRRGDGHADIGCDLASGADPPCAGAFSTALILTDGMTYLLCDQHADAIVSEFETGDLAWYLGCDIAELRWVPLPRDEEINA